MNLRKNKIFIVTPIFSPGALGGAEKLSLEYATLLKDEIDITVLTTTSKDYRTWKNYYKEGIELLNGIKVIRFKVEKERKINKFNKLHKNFINHKEELNDKEFQKWLESQGPYSPGLIRFIDDHKEEAHLFFFITYLYYSTVLPISLVKSKSICALTLHDEPPAYFPQFKKLYTSEIAYSFSTIEEFEIYKKIFGVSPSIYSIIGVNVEKPNLEIIKEKKLENKYILYIGRIDEGKGIGTLLEYYSNWRKKSENVPELYILGGGNIPEIAPEGVYFKGFVPLEDKYKYIKNSLFLINPSPMESFSIVLMESWLYEKPVVVNSKCETMKNHCIRSNGGLYFSCIDSFQKIGDILISNNELREKMGKNGAKYVMMNYSSKVVKTKLLNLIQAKFNETKTHSLSLNKISGN